MQHVSEKDPFRHRHEWHLHPAVGLTLHHTTPNRKLIDFLHGICQSVDYRRILRLETQLANAVIEKMKRDGVYIPPMMVQSKFIYFAIENTGFSEDTPDGKRTLHGTVTAISQRKAKESEELPISLDNFSDNALESLPVTEVVPCVMDTKNKPMSPTYENFKPKDVNSYQK